MCVDFPLETLNVEDGIEDVRALKGVDRIQQRVSGYFGQLQDACREFPAQPAYASKCSDNNRDDMRLQCTSHAMHENPEIRKDEELTANRYS